MNKILEIKERVPKTTTLPDGIYSGIWGGYNIAVNYLDKNYELRTEEGVKGFNIKVVVNIKGDEMTFQEVKN